MKVFKTNGTTQKLLQTDPKRTKYENTDIYDYTCMRCDNFMWERWIISKAEYRENARINK
jgi:hypothetical protein